jgi:hypothetical protein
MHQAQAFFVIRSKSNTVLRRLCLKTKRRKFQLGSGCPVCTVAAAKCSLQFILPTRIDIGDLAKKGSRRLLGVGNDGVLLLLL